MSRELPEGWHVIDYGYDAPRRRSDGDLLAYVRGQWRPAEVSHRIGPGARVNRRTVDVMFETGEVNLDGKPYRSEQRVPVGRLAVRDVASLLADVLVESGVAAALEDEPRLACVRHGRKAPGCGPECDRLTAAYYADAPAPVEGGLDVERIRADVFSLRSAEQVELDVARARRGGHPGPARRTTSLRLTEPEFEAIEAAVRLGYGAGLNAVVARLIRDELPEALGRHAVDGLGD